MEKRPRISILTGSLSRRAGGMLSTVGELTQALHRQDRYDLRVIGLRDRWTDADASTWEGIPTTACRSLISDHVGYAPGIQAALSQGDPALLHTHGIWFYPSWAASKWKQKTRRPEIITLQGMLESWTQHRPSLRRRIAARLFERRHLQQADCIHALTTNELADIRKMGLINPVCIVPNGVLLPSVGQGQPSLPAPYQSLIQPQHKVLLYLGRIQAKKGLPNLLQAWAQVPKRERQDWRLMIAGWNQDQHEEALKAQRDALHLSDEIHFIGPQFQEMKEACFRHANAFILPSHSEGMPMAVLEAWSYLLPSIITPACNLSEGVIHGASLESVPEANALALALGQLFRMSEQERTLMGQHGRSLVEARFTWEHAAAQMASVYQWLLHLGPKPSCVTNHA